MMAGRRLRLKLSLSYAIVAVVSFGSIAFFLDRKLEEISLGNIRDSLVIEARLISSQIAPESLRREDTADLEALAVALSRKAKCRITVVGIKGKVLADSEKQADQIGRMENHLGRPEVRSAIAGDVGIDTRYSPTLRINMLYAAIPVKDREKIAGVVRLALPLESVQQRLFAIRGVIILGLLFALVLAFILGSLIAGKITGPIQRMIRVSRRYSEGDFSRRIIHAPHDEIGELAATLNKMARGIEEKNKEAGAQNQKLAAVFNSMIEGIIVIDASGRIVSINPAIEKIFNVWKEEVVGKTFLEAVRNNDIPDIIERVLKKGESMSGEVSLVMPVRRVFQVNATPVFDEGGVNGCVVVIHDITEMRRLETVRSDFVANVSHELKTPLTSIKGFVETLLEGALDDKENSRNFLKIIQDHADRLDSLASDLLSLSHLESKEIVLEKGDVGLRQLAEGVILGFKFQLRQKGIEAGNELPSDLSVRADRHRIEQVFTNLIDNAIKFNKDKGSVKVSCRETDGAVTIIVEDSGIGIPRKDIPRIFERFYRVDKARSRELGGTGLGLSIVKHIVGLHGGSVGVESAEGFGSKFWFTLPR